MEITKKLESDVYGVRTIKLQGIELLTSVGIELLINIKNDLLTKTEIELLINIGIELLNITGTGANIGVLDVIDIILVKEFNS